MINFCPTKISTGFLWRCRCIFVPKVFYLDKKKTVAYGVK